MTDAPEAAGHPAPEPPPSGGTRPQGPRPALLWGALAAAIALGALQAASVLLHDEPGPRVAVRSGSEPKPPVAGEAPAATKETTRADGGGAASPPSPTLPAIEPPSPPAVAPPPPEAAAPAPAGESVLQLGVYRRQKYRREAEETATRLGLPHFCEEGRRSGTSFRVRVRTEGTEAAARAAALLGGAGCAWKTTPEGIEARFSLEDDARAAAAAAESSGLGAAVAEEKGGLFWTVYAGPFPEGEARSASERLGREGVEHILRKRR